MVRVMAPLPTGPPGFAVFVASGFPLGGRRICGFGWTPSCLVTAWVYTSATTIRPGRRRWIC